MVRNYIFPCLVPPPRSTMMTPPFPKGQGRPTFNFAAMCTVGRGVTFVGGECWGDKSVAVGKREQWSRRS